MVVFRHRAEVGVAQLQHHLVVDRHLDRLADPHVLVKIAVLVEAHRQRRRRHRLGLLPAETVEDVDEIAGGLVGHVDLVGIGGGDDGRRIGAHVDVFDPLEPGAAINRGAPPVAAGIAHQHLLDADFVHLGQVGAGADRVHRRIAAVIGRMHHCGRIIGHAGDDGDVGRRQRQFHRQVVDHGDRAVARGLARLVDQRAHPRSHRVALDIAVAPAGDVEGDIGGGEGIAVRPCDAGADVQGIFGGVVVDIPAFQQHAAEAAVGIVFDQVFQPAAGKVGDLRPVGNARILQPLGLHVEPERAAGLRRRLSHRRRIEAEKRVGGGGAGAKRRGAGQEFAAVHPAAQRLFRIHRNGRMQAIRRDSAGHGLSLPVRLVSVRIPGAL